MNRIIYTLSQLCFLLFCSLNSSAQLINMDTVIYPISTTGQSFENYLVSLAWENNPEYKIHATNMNIANKEVLIAKRAWADDWNITLNLNENNLTSTTSGGEAVTLQQATKDGLIGIGSEEIIGILEAPGQAINVNNFPRYNFGLTLNLGSLITRGLEVDIAEQKLEIEQFTADQDKLEIRSEVYMAYTEYNQAIKVLKVVAKQEQNTKDIFDLMKTRFKSGSIDFDKYNQSSSEYNRSLESLITAEEKVNSARLKIEALIGIPLTLARFYYDENNG